MNKYLLISFLLLYVAPSHAQEFVGQLLDGDRHCYVHEYDPGEIIRLNVAPFAQLHVEMFTGIFAVSLGAERMWNASFTPGIRHLWVKAKTEDGYSGQTTTMTLIDRDLNAYNFVLNRKKNPGYTCAVIDMGSSGFSNDGLDYLSTWESDDARRANRAEEKVEIIDMLAEQRIEAVQQHAIDQINTQRARLYTHYTWDESNSGSTNNVVRSVMDDGIVTYVTLNNMSSGLMSMYGVFDNKEYQVQASYEPQLQQYTITGVFTGIVMRYENSIIEISRVED